MRKLLTFLLLLFLLPCVHSQKIRLDKKMLFLDNKKVAKVIDQTSDEGLKVVFKNRKNRKLLTVQKLGGSSTASIKNHKLKKESFVNGDDLKTQYDVIFLLVRNNILTKKGLDNENYLASIAMLSAGSNIQQVVETNETSDQPALGGFTRSNDQNEEIVTEPETQNTSVSSIPSNRNEEYQTQEYRSEKASSTKRSSFGLRAGINGSYVRLKFGDITLNTPTDIGFHVGAYYEMALTEKLYFRPAALFTSRLSEDFLGEIQSFNSIEMPLDFVYKFGKLSLNLGPYASISLSEGEGLSFSDKLDYGISSGIAYELSKLTFGLNSFFGIKNLDPEEDSSAKNALVSFYVAYRF